MLPSRLPHPWWRCGYLFKYDQGVCMCVCMYVYVHVCVCVLILLSRIVD